MVNLIETDFQSIPPELKSLKQWVVWKLESRGSKPTKVPYNAVSGKMAQSNNPDTWSTFDVALSAFRNGGYSGIGFQFAGGYMGVDLDHCRDSQTGVIEPWAMSIILALDTYTEVSPSGTGIHMICRASLPGGRGRKTPAGDPEAIELYSVARYFCMTGCQVREGSERVENRQREVDSLLSERFPPDQSSLKIDTPGPRTSLDERIRKYLDQVPPAVAGQRGHDVTFRVASILVEGFGLSVDQARPHMDYYSAKCDPPWSDREVQHKLKSAEAKADPARRGYLLRDSKERPQRSVGTLELSGQSEAPGAPADCLDFHTTDLGNAERYASQHGGKIRFDCGFGRWRHWDGGRWALDNEGIVHRLAFATVRSIHKEAAAASSKERMESLSRWACRSESRERLGAMVALAEKLEVFATAGERFNSNPYLLNVENGTLDLKTFELKPHDPGDLITKIAPVQYHPNARNEILDQFLKSKIPDPELRRYLQVATGYTLLGYHPSELIFFLYGPKRSGKTTFAEAKKGMLGDYSGTCEPSLLYAKNGGNGGGPSPELARLQGLRDLITSELDDRQSLSGSLLKRLSGNDTIVARHLHAAPIEFQASFQIWMLGNDRPRANADDAALWARLRVIGFSQSLENEKCDPTIKIRMVNDPEVRAALLAWAIEGLKVFHAEGFPNCKAVALETSAYRDSQDIFNDFIVDCCELGDEFKTSAKDLRKAYEEWSHENGYRFPLTRKGFSEKLESRGCHSKRSTGGAYVWFGIRLSEPSELSEVNSVFSPHEALTKEKYQNSVHSLHSLHSATDARALLDRLAARGVAVKLDESHRVVTYGHLNQEERDELARLNGAVRDELLSREERDLFDGGNQ